MKLFEITLRNDAEIVSIQTRASSIESAKAIILQSERAPESAIQTWRVVPTKRQIAKTKSLLRGL